MQEETEESNTGDESDSGSTVSIDTNSTGTDGTMVDTYNPTEVQNHFLKELLSDLTPILTPTKLDIIRLTDTMAASLTHCESKLGLMGGQTYLVLTEPEYQLRVRKPGK